MAISIPIFTTQLEKSRDSVSVSNLRAAYAQASAAFLTANGKAVTEGNVTVSAPGTDGSATVTVSNLVFKGTNSSDNFSGLASELPFSNVSDLTEPTAGQHNVQFAYSSGSDVPTVTIS